MLLADQDRSRWDRAAISEASALLAALDAIAARVRSNLWHAARADALRQLGRTGEARRELSLALDLAQTGPDRRLLARRLAALSSDPGGG